MKRYRLRVRHKGFCEAGPPHACCERVFSYTEDDAETFTRITPTPGLYTVIHRGPQNEIRMTSFPIADLCSMDGEVIDE